MKRLNDLKIALVHDFLVNYGGAERVLEVLSEMFPEAPIYTLLYDREKMRGKFSGKEIHTSFLQKFPKFLRRRQKWLLPFIPSAPETFDLRDYDLVISSSGAWSKGIVTKLNTIHIAYIHSPMRFAWDSNESYLAQESKRKLVSFFTRIILNYIRIWDRQAADRPDHLIANSKYTQARIEKYYRRTSELIYPPVDVNPKNIDNQSKKNDSLASIDPQTINNTDYKLPVTDYFLIVSRLSKYKGVDVVIEAFNKLELPLVVIGEGKEENRLKKLAGNNIKIIGWQNDEKLKTYYKNARALVFASNDDFGMTMVESMSFGTPTIAYRGGGALEIVEEGVTGEFFNAQKPEIVAAAVAKFIENEKTYDKKIIENRAGDFSKEIFKSKLNGFMEDKLKINH